MKIIAIGVLISVVATLIFHFLIMYLCYTIEVKMDSSALPMIILLGLLVGVFGALFIHTEKNKA